MAVASIQAGIFVSRILDQMMERLEEYGKDEHKLAGSVKEEISDLIRRMASVRDLLEDAEQKQFKSLGVQIQLKDLKELLYDVEDLLEGYATDVARLATTVGGQRHLSEESSAGIAHRIKTYSKKLKNITKDWRHAGLKIGGHSSKDMDMSNNYSRETSFLLSDESLVVGRDASKQEVITKLCHVESGDKLAVLPIVGMGGVGKTTLARLVYNDRVTVKEFFDLKIWVSVSSDHFDAQKYLRKIISAIRNEPCCLDSLAGLHKELAEQVKGRNFLLILDDAWNYERSIWESLLEPLRLGVTGSRVVVTTRNMNVADAITGRMDPVILGVLDKEEIWTVMERLAFKDKNGSCDYEGLRDIGVKIAEKLKGLPLAAKTVGGLLGKSLKVSHWSDVLDSPLWALEQSQEDVLPILLLTYQYLPAHLKQCFQSCSLFPKNHNYDEEQIQMGQLWMAHNFFEDKMGTSCLEEKTEQIFRELLSWSLLQREMHHIKMHDLIHDMAQFVSRGDHLLITSVLNLNENPQKLRHLSLFSDSWESMGPNELKVPCKYEKLRTLLCAHANFIRIDVRNVIGEWMEKLRWLRVLRLSRCSIEELPESLSNLKHLRYLDLSCTAIAKLPTSLTSLHNLQVLMLNDCHRLQALPDGMSNLVNLRQLVGVPELVPKINGLGRLESLQRLEIFRVQPNIGYKIEELERLDMLHGGLAIENLENVARREEAEKARLRKKTKLKHLSLTWSDREDIGNSSLIGDTQLAEEVLEALRINSNLERLYIKGYMGLKRPSWLESSLDGQSMLHLEDIKLKNCKRLETLPLALGHLKFLQNLSLSGLHNMKRVGYGLDRSEGGKIFQVLKFLSIEDMPELEEWDDVERGISLFPCLVTLAVKNCPKLRAVPALPSTLRKLDLQKVRTTALPHLQAGSDVESRDLPPPSAGNEPSMPTTSEDRSPPHTFELKFKNLDEELLEFENCYDGAGGEDVYKFNTALTGFFPLQTLVAFRNWCTRTLQHEICMNLVADLDSSDPSSEKPANSDSTCPSTWQMWITKKDAIARSLAWELIWEIFALNGGASRILELRITDSGITGIDGTLLNIFSTLTSLQSLTITCENLRHLPEAISNLSSLQHLSLLECHTLLSIANIEGVSSLTELRLRECHQLQSLSQMEGLSSLRELVIEGCTQLRSLPVMEGFSCLQYLRLSNFHQGQSLAVADIGLLTSLKELYLDDWPLLQSLPRMRGHPSLESLSIRVCPKLQSLPDMDGLLSLSQLKIYKCSGLQSLPAMNDTSSLHQFKLSYCPELRSLPGTNGLASLSRLDIIGCPRLQSLPDMENLSSLQHFRLQDCPGLQSLPDMNRLASLSRLEVIKCAELQSLPDMKQLSSLQNLKLLNCPQLQWFPGMGLPSSIQKFMISGCPAYDPPLHSSLVSPALHFPDQPLA